ncbi:MAG TPA: hypothetical protein VEQ85_07160, partial [Lacipirellulaceae bacterium]|nr:hypothetical protein [Lacipirellulaceae bacterium]
DPLDGGGEGWRELIPFEVAAGVQKRLITIINEERASLGLAAATRADLRFSVNTPGEVFVLNKQDGVLRMLTVAIPEPTGAALALAASALIGALRRRRRTA